MRHIVGMLVLLALLTAACGTDMVDSAEDCDELARVWEDGDQADPEFRDKVEARVADLAEEALDRGAGAEAVACRLLLSQAGTDDGEDFFMEGES
jgi:hypothetical protein